MDQPGRTGTDYGWRRGNLSGSKLELNIWQEGRLRIPVIRTKTRLCPLDHDPRSTQIRVQRPEKILDPCGLTFKHLSQKTNPFLVICVFVVGRQRTWKKQRNWKQHVSFFWFLASFDAGPKWKVLALQEERKNRTSESRSSMSFCEAYNIRWDSILWELLENRPRLGQTRKRNSVVCQFFPFVAMLLTLLEYCPILLCEGKWQRRNVAFINLPDEFPALSVLIQICKCREEMSSFSPWWLRKIATEKGDFFQRPNHFELVSKLEGTCVVLSTSRTWTVDECLWLNWAGTLEENVSWTWPDQFRKMWNWRKVPMGRISFDIQTERSTCTFHCHSVSERISVRILFGS